MPQSITGNACIVYDDSIQDGGDRETLCIIANVIQHEIPIETYVYTYKKC